MNHRRRRLGQVTGGSRPPEDADQLLVDDLDDLLGRIQRDGDLRALARSLTPAMNVRTTGRGDVRLEQAIRISRAGGVDVRVGERPLPRRFAQHRREPVRKGVEHSPHDLATRRWCCVEGSWTGTHQSHERHDAGRTLKPPHPRVRRRGGAVPTPGAGANVTGEGGGRGVCCATSTHRRARLRLPRQLSWRRSPSARGRRTIADWATGARTVFAGAAGAAAGRMACGKVRNCVRRPAPAACTADPWRRVRRGWAQLHARAHRDRLPATLPEACPSSRPPSSPTPSPRRTPRSRTTGGLRPAQSAGIWGVGSRRPRRCSCCASPAPHPSSPSTRCPRPRARLKLGADVALDPWPATSASRSSPLRTPWPRLPPSTSTGVPVVRTAADSVLAVTAPLPQAMPASSSTRCPRRTRPAPRRPVRRSCRRPRARG